MRATDRNTSSRKSVGKIQEIAQQAHRPIFSEYFRRARAYEIISAARRFHEESQHTCEGREKIFEKFQMTDDSPHCFQNNAGRPDSTHDFIPQRQASRFRLDRTHYAGCF